jgi:hypothetical protein
MLWALRPELPILNDGGVPMWLTVCVLTIARLPSDLPLWQLRSKKVGHHADRLEKTEGR